MNAGSPGARADTMLRSPLYCPILLPKAVGQWLEEPAVPAQDWIHVKVGKRWLVSG